MKKQFTPEEILKGFIEIKSDLKILSAQVRRFRRKWFDNPLTWCFDLEQKSTVRKLENKLFDELGGGQ